MDAILVFSGRSIEQMIEEGGSQAWALDAGRASRCNYIVCTQNRHSDVHRSGRAPHGAGFMVGKISDVITSTEDPGRFTIVFDEFARIDIPDLWGGWRNPVKYTTLEELGIDPGKLGFERVAEAAGSRRPPPQRPRPVRDRTPGTDGVTPLSLEAAKKGVAAYFGVPVEAIEITIRG
jgi:hypothetical protein